MDWFDIICISWLAVGAHRATSSLLSTFDPQTQDQCKAAMQIRFLEAQPLVYAIPAIFGCLAGVIIINLTTWPYWAVGGMLSKISMHLTTDQLERRLAAFEIISRAESATDQLTKPPEQGEITSLQKALPDPKEPPASILTPLPDETVAPELDDTTGHPALDVRKDRFTKDG